MSVFEKIPVNYVNSFTAVATWLDRIQQKIVVAFENIEATPQLSVRFVKSTGTANSYQVTTSDAYLIVDSRLGPMKLIFPTNNRTQAVVILNAYQGGAVTIVQSNGKAFGNAPAVITLDYNKTTEIVNSPTGWFNFGRS